MNIKKHISIILTLVLFVACIPMSVAYAYSMPYYITVDLSNNIVTVYSTLDDSVVRQMICSSGTLKYESPTGTYYMPKKRKSTERGDWYTFEDGYGKYGSRIVGNYLFHSYLFLTKNDEDVDWETYQAMGTNASHGCIRLYIEDAKWIADNCLAGTRVKLYHTDTRYEYIKERLYAETFTIDDGITYNEFLSAASSDDELGFNSEGEEVVALQERLIEMGLYAKEADGFYGPEMVRTISALQMLLGYPVTGVVTPAFLEVIMSDECPTSNICNLSEGMSGSAVVALQQTLAALGLYSGECHGEYDEATTEAVKEFQRAMEYNPDGIASSSLQMDMLESLDYLNNKFGSTGFMISYNEEITVVGTINASKRLNVRAKRDSDSTIIHRLDPGTKVTVIEIDDSWAKIYYEGDKIGYVRSSYVDTEEVVVRTPEYVAADSPASALPRLSRDSNYAISHKVGFGTVDTKERLRIREKMDTDSDIVFMLSPGNVCQILSVEDGWAHVSYGGKTGYAYSRYFDIEYYAELTGTYATDIVGDIPDSPYIAEVVDEPITETPIVEDVPAHAALVIAEDGADLMTAASENSEVLAHADNGTVMDIIFESTSWTQVSFNDCIGYVSNEHLFIGSPEEIDTYIEENAEPEVVTGIVNTGSESNLNMRAAAAADGEVITELSNGAEVIILEAGAEWHYISYGDHTGYVMSQFIEISSVEPADVPAEVEAAVETSETVTEETASDEIAAEDASEDAVSDDIAAGDASEETVSGDSEITE